MINSGSLINPLMILKIEICIEVRDGSFDQTWESLSCFRSQTMFVVDQRQLIFH